MDRQAARLVDLGNGVIIEVRGVVTEEDRRLHNPEHRLIPGLDLSRPFARVQTASISDRRRDPALKQAFTIECWRRGRLERGTEFIQLPPCEVCGIPTGSWCDACDNEHAALCLTCEEDGFLCDACADGMH